MDVHHSQANVSVLRRGADIQPRSLDSAPDPSWLRLSLVLGATNINSNAVTAHVFAVEQVRVPRGLLVDTFLCCHERGDDVDGLCNVCHADILCLADEHIAPYGNGKGVGKIVSRLK